CGPRCVRPGRFEAQTLGVATVSDRWAAREGPRPSRFSHLRAGDCPGGRRAAARPDAHAPPTHRTLRPRRPSFAARWDPDRFLLRRKKDIKEKFLTNCDSAHEILLKKLLNR
ncbi:Protein of unknown function, partial [Gryllus bimaculatus]